MTTYGSGAYGAGPYGGGLTQANLFKRFGASPMVLVEVDYLVGDSLLISGSNARFDNKHFLGKLRSLGRIERTMQKTLGIFEMNSIEIIVSDVDQVAASVIRPIKGAIATVKVGTKQMALGEYKTVAKGLIDDFGILEQSFRLVIKDPLFNLPEEPLTGTVNETDFPRSFVGHRDSPLPVCYGPHSITEDDDARNRGAWPTLYIDNGIGTKKFLVASHWVLSISEVYKIVDNISTLMTLGTDYTKVELGIINAQRMAYIAFTDAQFTAVLGSSANVPIIRCNVNGKMNADGSLMDNPSDVLNDFLAEYCNNPPIDGVSFQISGEVANKRNYRVAGGYTEKKTTPIVLQEMSRSHLMELYATSDGKIGVEILDLSIATLAQYREKRDIVDGSWDVQHSLNVESADDTHVINTVDYLANFHHGTLKFFSSDQKTDTKSISDYGVKRLTLEAPWATNATASVVAQTILGLFRQPTPTYMFSTGLRALTLELGEQIIINHQYGADGTSLSGKASQVRSISFQPDLFKVSVTAQDVSSIGEAISGAAGVFVLDDEVRRELTSSGTAGVVNTDATITITGGPADLSTVIQVGDHCWIEGVTNEGNRLHVVVAAPITATAFEAEDMSGTPLTVWTTESSITYRILPAWTTAGSDQKRYGHLAGALDQFSNGDKGKALSL